MAEHSCQRGQRCHSVQQPSLGRDLHLATAPQIQAHYPNPPNGKYLSANRRPAGIDFWEPYSPPMEDCNHFGCPPSFAVLAARTLSGGNVPESFHGADGPSELVRSQPRMLWGDCSRSRHVIAIRRIAVHPRLSRMKTELCYLRELDRNFASDPGHHKRMPQL